MRRELFFPTIETQRLRMNALEPDDAEALLAIFSDPEVMKYWNTPPWSSLNDSREFISQSNDSMRQLESIVLGMRLKDTGILVGKCMVFSFAKESKRAEIGFGLGREHWGKGYIQEGGEALIQYCFNELGLRRIEAEIDPVNEASARALEKLGFSKEGLLRERWEVAGVVSDSALYGRLATD